MAKTKFLSVRLDEQESALLEGFAKSHDWTKSHAARRLLGERLRELEAPAERDEL